MSKPKRVSVIVLNYNGEKLILRLLKTLANQTFKDFEIVFVDNNSTDRSLQIVQELLYEDVKNLDMKIIKNETNLGYCRGNNSGAHYAHGEYIVFLSNDTFLSPTWLEELVKTMDMHPTIAVAQSRLLEAYANSVQNDGLVMDIYGWCESIIVEKEGIGMIEPFSAMGASIIVRSEAFFKSCGFDPELFLGDYDLCWRLRLLGYDVATALKSICYHYGSYTQKRIITEYSGYLHSFREKVRVSIKNHSLGNLLRRIPLTIALMITNSIYMTIKRKNPCFLLASIGALAWNLKYLRNTLMMRERVQRTRKISDFDLEKRMIHYPVLVADFRRWIIKTDGLLYYRWGGGFAIAERDRGSRM